MPLILDDDDVMDTDSLTGAMPVELDDVDLFGDPVLGEAVASLSLPPRTHSQQIVQRMDELRGRGCCQGIAWSKQGTIAAIGADGRSVDLYFLRARPKDASWGLSEPTPFSQFGSNFQGGPIVHLAWAATGSPELAVIDSVGRISLLSFSMTINRPYQVRSWDNDPVDDLHAVVGSYWLPLVPQNKQYNVVHGPALRDGNGYRYETSFVHAFGPYHPNQAKSALLVVTTNGVLKLFFSQNNNRVQETPIELESITTSDDLFTHASMCSEKNQPQGMLYVALATASRQLRIMKVVIQWGPPQADKQVPPGSNLLSPTMVAKPVAITSWFQQGAGESVLDPAMTELSHIEMLPSARQTAQSAWTPPLVLTVRSHVPTAGVAFSQELQSIIDRWEVLTEQQQPLHSAFEQLGLRGGPPPAAQPVARLRKLEPIVFNKVVVSLHTIQYGKVICIAFSDGTLHYRDRFTFNEIYHEIDVNRIMSLYQVGFRYPESAPCLQVALSPTNCSFVQICEDGKVKWNSLHYPVLDGESGPQDKEYSAIVAGLTTAVSTASFNMTSYDDILTTARQFADKPRFAYDWMMEIVRMMKIAVDYSEDAHHDQLVRNSHLQLCLSILNHLGFRGEFRPRDFCGKFALLALNVRNIVILITIASNSPISLKEKLSPLDEPEVVDALAGCAKWTLDLLAYLADCLFNLMDDPEFLKLLNPAGFGELVRFLQSRQEVALHLMLCSSTRGFLSAACRRLLHLDSLSKRAIHYYENRTQSALSVAYQKMQHYTSSSMIKVQEFDRLLSALGAEVRGMYQASFQRLPQVQAAKAPGAGPTAQQAAENAVKRSQMQAELMILLASQPPNSFLPVLAKFFHQELRQFRAQTDPARLFFADYAVLEVDDDEHTLAANRARRVYVDVFKRVELVAAPPQPPPPAGPEGGAQAGGGTPTPWRRCVRCAAVMEDVYGHRPGHMFVLAQQRKCSCGGNWEVLAKGTLAS